MTSPSTEPWLDHWPDGWHVEWVAETGSTNADLVAAGNRGAPHRTVLAADLQTAGRGRLDRRWDAPSGANLLVSLLLRDLPEHPHEVIQRVALAAAVAAEQVAGVEAVLKWPNDILVGGAKLAGVLAQAGSSATDPSARTDRSGPTDPVPKPFTASPFVVVGIGVNVGWAPEGAARLGAGIEPRRVLHALLDAYDKLPADISVLYRQRLATIGQQVRVELPGDRFLVGRAVGVEADGQLVVLDDCAISHRIDTGDVVHLRPAP